MTHDDVCRQFNVITVDLETGERSKIDTSHTRMYTYILVYALHVIKAFYNNRVP